MGRSRQGDAFIEDHLTELEAMRAWVDARTHSELTIEVSNITTTSVEVEVQGTFAPGAKPRRVLTRMAARLTTHHALDFRKSAFGADVDNSLLLTLARGTPGLQTLDTATFLPAASFAFIVSEPRGSRHRADRGRGGG